MKHSVLAAAQLVALAAAGTTVWDGSFNDMTTASLDDWSWSNQAGAYQWYIHGTSNTSAYLAFDASFANSADGSATQGARVTLDDTAYWNGQTMRRTELIPQVDDAATAIASGTRWYHFSLRRAEANAPAAGREHQIAFFESHFTELKYGGDGSTKLRWMAGSEEQWSVDWAAGVWHNCAYEIDFDAGTVAFWHSTGGDELAKVVEAVDASASSNGADWHVGVLELEGGTDADEDVYFSGVYIESGDLTTSFSGGGSSASSSSGSASSAAGSSSAVASSTAEAAANAASVASSSSSSSSTVAAVQSSAAPVASSAAATTPLASSSAGCKRTKTVYVTQSA